MGFIYFLIGLAIGYNLIVFGGFQILSTFFTSIPTTARMKKMGYSVDKNIYGRFAFVIILWAVFADPRLSAGAATASRSAGIMLATGLSPKAGSRS